MQAYVVIWQQNRKRKGDRKWGHAINSKALLLQLVLTFQGSRAFQ